MGQICDDGPLCRYAARLAPRAEGRILKACRRLKIKGTVSILEGYLYWCGPADEVQRLKVLPGVEELVPLGEEDEVPTGILEESALKGGELVRIAGGATPTVVGRLRGIENGTATVDVELLGRLLVLRVATHRVSRFILPEVWQ